MRGKILITYNLLIIIPKTGYIKLNSSPVTFLIKLKVVKKVYYLIDVQCCNY